MEDRPSDLVTIREAAERTGIDGVEIYRRIFEREIPAQRTERGRVVITTEVLDRLIAES